MRQGVDYMLKMLKMLKLEHLIETHAKQVFLQLGAQGAQMCAARNSDSGFPCEFS